MPPSSVTCVGLPGLYLNGMAPEKKEAERQAKSAGEHRSAGERLPRSRCWARRQHTVVVLVVILAATPQAVLAVGPVAHPPEARAAGGLAHL